MDQQLIKDWIDIKEAQTKLLNDSEKVAADIKILKDLAERMTKEKAITLSDLQINGENIIDYYNIDKRNYSPRKFIGLVLSILREKVELQPELNTKEMLIQELSKLKPIYERCVGINKQRVFHISTDLVRKLFTNQQPTYSALESRHAYQLSYWLVDCRLRAGTSLVILDGTNLELVTKPSYRKKIFFSYQRYNPLFLFFEVTKEQALINSREREKEGSYYGKSDADIDIFTKFNRYLKKIPDGDDFVDFIIINTRHDNYSEQIKELVDKIITDNHRLLFLSGNVLSGKTYTAHKIINLYLQKTASKRSRKK